MLIDPEISVCFSLLLKTHTQTHTRTDARTHLLLFKALQALRLTKVEIPLWYLLLRCKLWIARENERRRSGRERKRDAETKERAKDEMEREEVKERDREKETEVYKSPPFTFELCLKQPRMESNVVSSLSLTPWSITHTKTPNDPPLRLRRVRLICLGWKGTFIPFFFPGYSAIMRFPQFCRRFESSLHSVN